MGSNSEFRDYVLDQLDTIEGVTARAMFGGFGVFQDGVMFALIAKDTLYFKVDDENRIDYESAGMPPFRYARSGKTFEMSYWQAPSDVLDDPDDLSNWARSAIAAAQRGRLT